MLTDRIYSFVVKASSWYTNHGGGSCNSTQTDKQKNRQTDRQTDTQTDKQTDKQTDGQTDGRTDRHEDGQADNREIRETRGEQPFDARCLVTCARPCAAFIL